MKKDPNANIKFIKYLILSFLTLGSMGIGTYFYLQKIEIDQKNANSLIAIDKTIVAITDILSNPDNCLSSLRTKSLTNSKINQIENAGKKNFKVGTFLENSNVRIESIYLKNSTENIAKNFTILNLIFIDEVTKHSFQKPIKLYTEVDKIDQVTYCQAISSTFESQTKSNVILRVKHSRAKGILAKYNENKVSIAAASCPDGYQLTGCTGSVNDCPFENLSPYKVEIQALSPNTCEVWAKSTEKCEIMALATAICLKIVSQ